MSQFKKLDDLIVARIAGKGIQFTPLFSSNDVHQESQQLGDALGRESFRVLDGRLQALKRKGSISYGTKTGWVIKRPEHVVATSTEGKQCQCLSKQPAQPKGLQTRSFMR